MSELRSREFWEVPFAGGTRETQPHGTNNHGVDYTQFGLSGHNGNDLIPYSGDWNVRSVSNGVVVKDYDTPVTGYGNYITIWDAENNLAFQYSHLANNTLSVGDIVVKGQVIGVMGNTGFVTGPHLHLMKFDVNDNGVRLNANNGTSGAIDTWQCLENCNAEFKAKAEVALIETIGNEKIYTVQGGGWRSNVIEEMIMRGVLEGTWQDNLASFDLLNPVTPEGGYSPGDKVVIEKIGQAVVVTNSKPKPAWMANAAELPDAITRTVEKDCDLYNIELNQVTIPANIKNGSIISLTHEFGEYYLTQESITDQVAVGYKKSCIDYVRPQVQEIQVEEHVHVHEEIPVTTVEPDYIIPADLWNSATKYVDTAGVTFLRLNSGKSYTEDGKHYMPVGEFQEINSQQEVINTPISEEYAEQTEHANTESYVKDLIDQIKDKAEYEDIKSKNGKVLAELVRQGDKKFPGIMQILRIAPIRKALTIIARYILFPFSAIQAGGNLLEGDMISWQEVLKLIDGLGNFFGF